MNTYVKKAAALAAMVLGSALFAQDYPDSFDVGMTEMRFNVSGETGSQVRVIAFLPDAGKWNGRLIMRGSGGGAGFISLECKEDAKRGFVGCYCDMGTCRPWVTEPRCVITDFGHRGTHLAIVRVKELVKGFYGKLPQYSYFIGCSTGGCQAYSELQRYPEDFDGIIGGVPAAARLATHYYFAWLALQILNEKGEAVLKDEYFQWMKEAALDGKGYLEDSRYTEERYAKTFAKASAAHPELKDPEVAKRLKACFSGAMLGGKKVHHGLPLGTIPPLGDTLVYFQFFHQWKYGKGLLPHALTEKQFLDLWADYSPDCDQLSTNLDAFRDRGGKFLSYAGMADSIVPPYQVADWYDAVIKRYGSREAVRKFARLYLLPGGVHGVHGFGEAARGVSHLENLEEKLFAWVEKGVEPPLTMPGVVPEEKTSSILPVKPYPEIFE